MCFGKIHTNNFFLNKRNIIFIFKEMDSLIALLTILRYNPSLKSIDISRPVPQYQHSNWMDDIAIHIAHMLEVKSYFMKFNKV